MARRTKGRIYKNDGANYWLEYRHAGKRHRVSLQTGNMDAARVEAARILRPFTAATEADRHREAASAVLAAENTVVAAIAEANRVDLPDVWQRFPLEYTTRRGTRAPLKAKTVAAHRTYWEAFRTWITAARSDCKYLEAVTQSDAKLYAAHLLASGMHPRTVTYHRNSLNALWRNAGRPSPWTAVDRYTAPVESRRHLEDEELRKVCSAATGERRRLLAVGLYTGLRLGDAVSLDWKDLRKGWIYRRTAKRGVHVSFPVHPELAAVLADVAKTDQTGAVFPELRALYEKDSGAVSKQIREHMEAYGVKCEDRYAGNGGPTGKVKDKPKGKRRKASGKAQDKTAETPAGRRIARVGFHSLRHSFATICAKAGIPQGSVAAWLGHTPAVDEIYQHFGSKDTERIVQVLPTGVFTGTAPRLTAGDCSEGDRRAKLHQLVDQFAADRLAAAVDALEALAHDSSRDQKTA